MRERGRKWLGSKDHREANAEAIAKFLELHSSYIGPGSLPDEPLGQKSKGSSRPPATNSAMNFWSANLEAARYINWRVGELRKHDVGFRGIRFSEVLTTLYGEPAIIQRWRAAETNEDKAYRDAFMKMCRLLADSIAAANPDVRLVVRARLQDEPQPDKTAAYRHDRRVSQGESHRRRYERFRALERHMGVGEPGGATREAAKAVWAEREGLSVPTIERAINYVERKDGAA